MSANPDPGPRPTDIAPSVEWVDVYNRQDDYFVDGDRWGELVRLVLVAEGVTAPWEVGLSFVAEDEMASLNSTYRSIDRPTDVLAFGADDGRAPRAQDEPRLVGDVVICPAVAVTNAAADGRVLDDELALLVVHGTLHLLGYDHQDDADAEVMQGRESALLAAASEDCRWP